MTFKLNPAVLRYSYDFLCTTEPFCRWNLPDGDDVVFEVGRTAQCFGWYNTRMGKHVITISRAKIGQVTTLIETMAHEMIHLHIQNSEITDTSDHGRVFRRLAARVCKVHTCFDPKRF